MRRLLQGALLTLAVSGQARGEDDNGFVWSVTEAAYNTVTLAYAKPDSDNGLFWVFCSRETGVVEVNPSIEARAAKDGERAPVRLIAGDVVVEFEGDAAYTELNDVVEMRGALSSPKDLSALFENPGELQVKVPGNETRISINRQAQDAFIAFRNTCPSLR